MRPVFDFLRYDDLPFMTRPNFVVELRHFALWSVVVGAIEGNIAAVVASNTFGASKLLTTIVWAVPLLANILNIVWGAVLRGRRRVPMVILLAGCALVCICSVALIPNAWHPWGGWCFAAQLALTHVFMSGLITLRTSIWAVNYPRSHRARIAGRLQSLRFGIAVAAASLLGLLFDWDASYYRYAYPTLAAIGALALLPLRRLRVRGERRELRRFREHIQDEAASTNSDPSQGLRHGLRESLAILRRDRRFAGYLVAQSFLGSANFMVDPVLVSILTKQLFRDQYFLPGVLMLIIPVTMVLITIRYWAAYFDRVGVLRFRILNGSVWTASYVAVTAAILVLELGGPGLTGVAIGILVFARILNGIGRGGGAVAWPLGHLHFAGEHQAELYMGIHVALTGLRGLVMPLTGWALHEWLGWGSFFVAVLAALVANVLFVRLYRHDRRAALEQEAQAEEIGAPAAGADQAS
ncbi:MAG: MFS transporter [Planctomycetes bacterium]|nr:MFS transporter [Planctomycetota bacterium]